MIRKAFGGLDVIVLRSAVRSHHPGAMLVAALWVFSGSQAAFPAEETARIALKLFGQIDVEPPEKQDGTDPGDLAMAVAKGCSA
jgi:hypothetical protein